MKKEYCGFCWAVPYIGWGLIVSCLLLCIFCSGYKRGRSSVKLTLKAFYNEKLVEQRMVYGETQTIAGYSNSIYIDARGNIDRGYRSPIDTCQVIVEGR